MASTSKQETRSLPLEAAMPVGFPVPKQRCSRNLVTILFPAAESAMEGAHKRPSMWVRPRRWVVGLLHDDSQQGWALADCDRTERVGKVQ
jgi:hypothetical protein